MATKQAGKSRSFKIDFPEEDLQRLQSRLDDIQLPADEIVPGADWAYGTNLQKLRQLTEDWKQGRPRGGDGTPVSSSPQGVAAWWRGVEKRLNKHPHYLVEIEGVQVHYQYARSADEHAIPFIFSHGWPGSFFEAHYIIDELTRTDRKGPSFHVIVPSLVGYGFSGPPPRKGWTLQDTARLFNSLMTDVLGFSDGYFAQGGDWGSAVTRYLSLHPACKMFHLNFAVPNIPLYAAPLVAFAKAGYMDQAKRLLPYLYDEFETRGLRNAMDYITTGNGYYILNSTKPSSQGYAMYQSPIGILSYLLDKYETWTDPKSPAFNLPGQGRSTSGITDENILINVTLYYLTKTFHTSLLPYYESNKAFDQLGKNRKLTQPGAHKPFGYSAFPHELAAAPKAWIPRLNVNMVFYKRHDYGGHFASLEAPQAFSDDMREFAAAHWTA